LFGLFAKSRALATSMAVAFLALGGALAAIYLFSPHAVLRLTTGPEGGQAHRFINAFIKVTEARHPRVRIKTVTVDNLRASADALEQGKVDLAIIRSDVHLPANGETLVILRHDAMAFIVPHHSEISGLPDLSGKTIALAEGPAQDDNSHALDILLSYYNIAPDKVKRLFLPAEEIGAAIAHKKASAALAVGPVGPGDVVATVASIEHATKGAPTILGFDDADAIVQRFPIFESMDVPQGGFHSRPDVPDDDVTTIGVNYRFAVPITMPDIVANAIGRSIMAAKGQLMNLSPLAGQIEAPDVSDQNPLLPIHPGFADYLNNGDQSFFDQAQRYLYIVGIPLSLAASLLTVLYSRWSARGAKKDRDALRRLVDLANDAATADRARLESLEQELHKAVAASVGASGANAAEQWKTSLAVQHAMRRFEQRRAALAAASGAEGARPEPGPPPEAK
jgi:TRAP-type uncharacterized transport system substrate-binding protein